MKRFKNILVVFNEVVGEDDTLTQATSLAKRNNARLTVIEVVEDGSLPPNFIAEREKQLHRLTASIEQEGIPLSTLVLAGTPFLEIIRQVLRQKYDLVMMAAEGETAYRRLFFGSTSLKLIRKCPCPVWVTKPGGQNNYARIMAAVGPPSDDADEDELNIKILDLATSLAHLNNSELHIAHAWEVSGNDLDTLQSETTEDIRSGIYEKHELACRKRLERLLERYNLKGLKHRIHVVRGVPENALPELADTLDIDLIAMGTIRRAWIPGFIIGNTAELMLRQVNCAVLTVKPESFVTPVTLE